MQTWTTQTRYVAGLEVLCAFSRTAYLAAVAHLIKFTSLTLLSQGPIMREC
jgi:hypothetical protein